MNRYYSGICSHTRLTRLNNNFVRCLDCGQSIINQEKISGNKTRKDFTNENKTFERNFERNFTNTIDETDYQQPAPYEYYTDNNWANIVIINRSVQFFSKPPKYEVKINGKASYLTDEQISKLLADIKAVKVDKEQLEFRYNIGEPQTDQDEGFNELNPYTAPDWRSDQPITVAPDWHSNWRSNEPTSSTHPDAFF